MIAPKDMVLLLTEVQNLFGQKFNETTVMSWHRALDPNITITQAMTAVDHLGRNPVNGITRLKPSDINAEILREKRSHDSTRSQIDAWLDDRRIGGVFEKDGTSKRVELYRAIYKEIDSGESIEEACIHSVSRLYSGTDISVPQKMTFQEWYEQQQAEGEYVSPMLLQAFGTKEQQAQAEAQMKAGK